MSHYMLPFHKLQNYFLWLLFHVAQVIWAIPSITVMPFIIKVGKHAFLAARCKVIPLPSQPWQRQAKWKMVWLSFQPNALLLKVSRYNFKKHFKSLYWLKDAAFLRSSLSAIIHCALRFMGHFLPVGIFSTPAKDFFNISSKPMLDIRLSMHPIKLINKCIPLNEEQNV